MNTKPSKPQTAHYAWGNKLFDGYHAIVDSGATDHFTPFSYKGTDERMVTDGITVGCAKNGVSMQSIATDKFDLPSLPDEMRTCHKFPDSDIAEPLFSTNKVTEAGGSVHLFPDNVYVCDAEGKTILRGVQVPHRRHAIVPLTKTVPEANTTIPKDQQQHMDNITTVNGGQTKSMALTTMYQPYDPDTVQKLVQFLHATAGYPVKSTWLKAIDKNYYLSWPGLNSDRVRKYLTKSEHTIMGHLHLIRQGIRSTKKQPATMTNPLKTRSNQWPHDPKHTNWVSLLSRRKNLKMKSKKQTSFSTPRPTT